MHGPEHWLGLVRAWIVVGLFVYCVWSLLDVVRDRLIAPVLRRSTAD